jgi:sulfate adenylyltransferase
LLVSEARAQELKEEAVHLPSWDLTFRQIWDLELLLSGAFAPLKGFLGKADYDGVCKNMRLADGSLWPMPIMLDVTEELAGTLKSGARLALRHPEGMVLAVLAVSDVWKADKKAEAKAVLGTTSEEHPAVFDLMQHAPPV